MERRSVSDELIGLFPYAVQREQRAHARNGEVRITQESGKIGKLEKLHEVHEMACALLTTDHHEVRLMAIEPREKHHACLVEARGCLEDVPRQRHGGLVSGAAPPEIYTRER